ncbi:MAG: sialate O-acetylesterase [Lentisphaeria bacterium]
MILKTDSTIGNHAVLQHSQNILLSGTAIPDHHLYCKLDNTEITTKSAKNGKFKFIVPPFPPGGPLTLTINDEDSHETLTYDDIYIGNVYLLSGQSNMALTLGSPNDIQPEKSDPLIRQFALKKQAFFHPDLAISEGIWQEAKQDTLKNFSAVGFCFARELQKKSPNRAIGLLNASYGGTNIEAWIRREALLQSPITKEEVMHYEQEMSQRPLLPSKEVPERDVLEQKMLEDFFPKSFPNLGIQKAWHETDFDDQNWETMLLPDSWTLAGYNAPGIFWFRKEIELPENWKNKALELHIGAIDHQDIVYWNGITIGHTGEGLDITLYNNLRCYSIAPEQVNTTKNLLAIRVTSFFPISTNGGMVGPEKEMYLCCVENPKQKIPLTGEWKYQPEKILSSETLERCRHLGQGEAHSYHIMFDNMIAPLKNCKLSAIVFYQGEANTLGKTETYEGLLKLLIEDWRSYFAQPDLPFLNVQLPGFQTPRLYSEHSPWAKIRNAQLKVGLAIGIPPVVIAESGDAFNLHPPDKKSLGKRLAMTAQAIEGNTDCPLSGPVYRRMEKLPKGKIRLYFELYGSKMILKGEKVNHLVIAGADGVFHEAKSRLESSKTLLVWSDTVAHPEAVCYAWCENPANANLYNQAGQSASPFKTKEENET